MRTFEEWLLDNRYSQDDMKEAWKAGWKACKEHISQDVAANMVAEIKDEE